MLLSISGNKIYGILALAGILLVGFFAFSMPVSADPVSDDPGRGGEHQNYDDERDAEEERAYNRWLEERARHYAEHHDCRHHRYSDCDCRCDCHDSQYRYYEPEKEKHKPSTVDTDFHIGLLFSPENRNGVAGSGIEFLDLDDNPFGGTLWMAGDPGFFFTGSEIDAAIPHDDYSTSSNTGEIGFIFEIPMEIDDSMWFVLGAGATFQTTHYTDQSNVTGWDWDGGSNLDDFIPSGQASLLFRLGDSGAIRIGYDSHYEWFFGIVF